ncbi:protein translocase subunit SecDF [Elizabethkingia anophelis]|uniref:Multifunctional fusion protein n=1 Tax=Elizabethkingia anophelis NUHP1 TaxID=1338011 RepID=A0A077EEK3_9FLAO|nr:protein translocase subunit SecDF [Elizabethkingia anophelis]AIL45942.1 Protein-export membrane protein SecD / Protein-export membrane protein SecF [Elizabethkingia anophelis NUHP1]MBE9392674.1 protein translocase subunit SecDF [Elizabethkingia anophelis]MBE9407534.1 protein translocase subunit SecDF [Elizabethkingia anophelis]QGN24693.1 protein translocase subunit SecDF [Elizabethkingia anophelis]QNV11329.1 protein translocase subunit SecDF [Elizabethkingia anophelis]
MQGKGLITTIAIILGLICINELLPSFYANRIEKEAQALSGGNEVKYKKELEKLSKDTLNLGFTKLDYRSAKEKEMKLGLDLKGGINVLLEINQRDLVNDLTNYSTNPVLVEALNRTDAAQKFSTKTYIDNFFVQFDAVNKEKGTNVKLSNPEVFGTQKLSDQIKFNTPDDEVKKIISKKIDASVGSAFEVIRTRIDKLGVTQPNVQRVPGTGRILVEMPGIKDIDRVKKLLQTSARLQFWEVQTAGEVAPYFQQLTSVVMTKGDSIGVNKNMNLINTLDMQNGARQNGVGNVKLSDTATVNKLLNSAQAIKARPANLRFTKFMWAAKPESNTPDNLTLYAIRGTANNKAPLDGAVKDARVNYDQIGRIEIGMQMDSDGTKVWKTLTEKNIGRPIAVTLDDNVYTAPNVNTAIPNGQSVITGNFSQDEAKDLVDVLNSGKLPATAKIVQADVVGPSLGAESINAGVMSFIIAFALIMVYIIFYYGMAGVYAVIAMIINLFYVFGIMDSIDATLTLPGIAGIVLSMAMAVDTNVIIYERTKEELFAGKGIREAYNDGFKHALSAIIDGHATTLLTAVVLYIFGTGPIQGFAVTLIIGILMTFFTSVLLSRVMIFSRLGKGKEISVWTSFSKNLFRNIWIDFIGKRKWSYIFSTILMVICITSIVTKGFKFGVDFKGGRSYVVRFDKPVVASDIQEELAPLFKTNDGKNEAVDVKTFGNSNQLRITTDYKIDDVNTTVDSEIEHKLYDGLKKHLPANETFEAFKSSDVGHAGIVSSTKVGPTVADDIQVHGTLAVLAALAGIFIYILLRFRKWQFSLGAVVALFHDAVVILGVFSLFYTVAPFNMEINQDFIAAVLTVLGYSINDTVIVFDRIREYLRERKSISLAGLFDDSISSTLGRTFNTSFTTILVILAIFIFGGDNMKGFMFALLIGIGFGTYSSIFIASAIAYDCLKGRKKDAPPVHEINK